MKIRILVIGCCLLLFACKKSATTTPSVPSSPSFVASITQYGTLVLRIDSLKYDTSHNLTELVHYDYDSTSGTPLLDTIYTVFSYATDSTPPTSYTVAGVIHQLGYDNMNRIIKDSSKDGSGNNVSFIYSANTIVYVQELFVPSYTITVDSLFLTNGNITTVLSYNPSSGGTDTLGEDYQYSAYNYTNPLYHPVMTHSIGPLLHFMTYDYYYQSTLADALSQKMATSVHATGTALAENPANLTSVITTDAQGRVIQSWPYLDGVLPLNGRIVYTYY
jgi:hypothetical protein